MSDIEEPGVGDTADPEPDDGGQNAMPDGAPAVARERPEIEKDPEGEEVTPISPGALSKSEGGNTLHRKKKKPRDPEVDKNEIEDGVGAGFGDSGSIDLLLVELSDDDKAFAAYADNLRDARKNRAGHSTSPQMRLLCGVAATFSELHVLTFICREEHSAAFYGLANLLGGPAYRLSAVGKSDEAKKSDWTGRYFTPSKALKALRRERERIGSSNDGVRKTPSIIIPLEIADSNDPWLTSSGEGVELDALSEFCRDEDVRLVLQIIIPRHALVSHYVDDRCANIVFPWAETLFDAVDEHAFNEFDEEIGGDRRRNFLAKAAWRRHSDGKNEASEYDLLKNEWQFLMSCSLKKIRDRFDMSTKERQEEALKARKKRDAQLEKRIGLSSDSNPIREALLFALAICEFLPGGVHDALYREIAISLLPEGVLPEKLLDKATRRSLRGKRNKDTENAPRPTWRQHFEATSDQERKRLDIVITEKRLVALGEDWADYSLSDQVFRMAPAATARVVARFLDHVPIWLLQILYKNNGAPHAWNEGNLFAIIAGVRLALGKDFDDIRLIEQLVKAIEYFQKQQQQQLEGVFESLSFVNEDEQRRAVLSRSIRQHEIDYVTTAKLADIAGQIIWHSRVISARHQGTITANDDTTVSFVKNLCEFLNESERQTQILATLVSFDTEMGARFYLTWILQIASARQETSPGAVAPVIGAVRDILISHIVQWRDDNYDSWAHWIGLLSDNTIATRDSKFDKACDLQRKRMLSMALELAVNFDIEQIKFKGGVIELRDYAAMRDGVASSVVFEGDKPNAKFLEIAAREFFDVEPETWAKHCFMSDSAIKWRLSDIVAVMVNGPSLKETGLSKERLTEVKRLLVSRTYASLAVNVGLPATMELKDVAERITDKKHDDRDMRRQASLSLYGLFWPALVLHWRCRKFGVAPLQPGSDDLQAMLRVLDVIAASCSSTRLINIAEGMEIITKVLKSEPSILARQVNNAAADFYLKKSDAAEKLAKYLRRKASLKQ